MNRKGIEYIMEEQEIFIEAIENLKDFAKLNGGVVTKQDIMDNFGGVELEEGQMQLIYGYLQNSHIKISDVEITENAFEKINSKSIDALEEVDEIDLKKDKLQREIDEENDKKIVDMYMEDLKLIEINSEKEERLLKMALEGDKKAEEQLIEVYLLKIVEWIEPFRNKGVPSADLIQEGNLILLTQISEKNKLSVDEWNTRFERILRDKIEAVCNSFIEEQKDSYTVSKKVLNKVNAVNDCVIKLSNELDRKVTIQEVAEYMGISDNSVKEAIDFSSNKIEDIVIQDTSK